MRAPTTCLILGLAACLAVSTADARERRDRSGGGPLPDLDVKSSCADAQKFSTGEDKTNTAYKGCMQDEMSAKSDLAKRWSTFNVKDRSNCVEQSRTPSPSYVEVLTCLEMTTDAIRNAPKVDGRAVPQIGGPVAPGLSTPVGTPAGPASATPVH